MKVTLEAFTPEPISLIYKAYRICYSKDTYSNIHVPDLSNQITFIKGCLKKGHTSPLEHVSFTFCIQGVSRALSHQLVRHRTFKFNQQSQRYVEGEHFNFVVPELIKSLDLEEAFTKDMLHFQNRYQFYQDSIYQALEASSYLSVRERHNLANENARSVLPNATTTQLVVTCDLKNFRNFLNLRTCQHAQEEIRALACEMGHLVQEHIPFVYYLAKDCHRTCFECDKKFELGSDKNAD